MPGKMSFDSRGHGPSRLIGWFASHNDCPQITQVLEIRKKHSRINASSAMVMHDFAFLSIMEHFD